MFSRCKSVQKMVTGKSDDQIIQPDNKLIVGTKSENSELAMIAWSTRRPQREQQRAKLGAEKGNKTRHFGPPPFGPPTL